MVKFEMVLGKPEDTVYEATAQSTIQAFGQTIDVGTHTVTFSGDASVNATDAGTIWNKDDDDITQFDCEILAGTDWDEVKQCSFIISPGQYHNTVSDEDDMQGWEVTPKKKP